MSHAKRWTNMTKLICDILKGFVANSAKRKIAVRCKSKPLTLTPLTWRIWWVPNNASRWRMGFNSAFKGLKNRSAYAYVMTVFTTTERIYWFGSSACHTWFSRWTKWTKTSVCYISRLQRFLVYLTTFSKCKIWMVYLWKQVAMKYLYRWYCPNIFEARPKKTTISPSE